MAKRGKGNVGIGQLTLIPERPPVGEIRDVPIADLVGPEKGRITFIGSPPDQSFISSIRMYGMRSHVILTHTREGWRVEDGLRRIQAVVVLLGEKPSEGFVASIRQENPDLLDDELMAFADKAWIARWSTIRAEVLVTDGTWAEGTLSLTMNEQRSENTALALQIIEKMIDKGFNEHDIWRATGMSLQSIRRVMGLMRLHPGLRSAFEAGDLKATTAANVAKCSDEQQDQLWVIYQAEGGITGSDVREVRKSNQRAIRGALSDIEQMPLDPNWWKEEVGRKLREAIDLAPPGHELGDRLRAILDELDRQVEPVRSVSLLPDPEE
jgi:hypothetical protein